MCKRHIYAPSSSFRRCRRKHSSVRRGGNGAQKFSVNGRLNGVRTELGQRVRGWLFGAACATHNLPFLRAARPHPSRTTPAFELGSSSRCGCVPPGVGSVEGSAKLSRSPRPPATIAKGTSRKRKLTGVGLRPSSSSSPAACYLSSPSSSPRPRLPFGVVWSFVSVVFRWVK